MGDLPILLDYVIPTGRPRADYWSSLGDGVLRDVLEISLTEDLFGTFYLEMAYPEDGYMADKIVVGKAIKIKARQDMTTWELDRYKAPGKNGVEPDMFYHRLGGDYQVFYVNDVEYDSSGVKIVRAVHYTYRLSEQVISMVRTDRYPKEEVELGSVSRPFQVIGDDWVRAGMIDSYYRKTANDMAFFDMNGNATNSDTPKARTNLGGSAVELYQDINQYSEVDPWTGTSAVNNWHPKTVIAKQRNFNDWLLGDDEESLRSIYRYEILRDRWAVVMTDRRSLKSWGDAYELRYGRDIKNIKVHVDMSDILTSIFPYVNIEDDYTFTEREWVTSEKTISGVNGGKPVTVGEWKETEKTVTCKMEVNLRGTTLTSYPLHSSGAYALVPQSTYESYMFKCVRKDITEYANVQKMITDVSNYKRKDGTYDPINGQAARWVLEDNIKEYLKQANLQFGEVTADIDFLPVWGTNESKYKVHLQRLRLGDPVVVIHEPLQLKIYSRVTETKYNPLTDEYDSIKLSSYSVVPLEN